MECEDLKLEASSVVLGRAFMEVCEVLRQSDALILVWFREGFPREHAHIAYGRAVAHPRLEVPSIKSDRFSSRRINTPATSCLRTGSAGRGAAGGSSQRTPIWF